jgi:hypothetical protein
MVGACKCKMQFILFPQGCFFRPRSISLPLPTVFFLSITFTFAKRRLLSLLTADNILEMSPCEAHIWRLGSRLGLHLG